MFNSRFTHKIKPGGERVKVPHFTSSLVWSHHYQAPFLKHYATKQEKHPQAAGSAQPENPTQNKV